jgi:hypothetical protein
METCNVCYVSTKNLLSCYNECTFITCLTCFLKLDRNEKAVCPQCKCGFTEYIYINEYASEYEGEMFKRKPHGKGKLLHVNESVYSYEGEFINGIPVGPGDIVFENGLFAKDVILDTDDKYNFIVADGTIIIRNDDTVAYEGLFEDGMKSYGTQYYEENYYHGNFENGKRHGKGIMHYKSGFSFTGDWSFGKFTGKGGHYNRSKKLYEGSFVDSKYHGIGKLFLNEKLYFDGIFMNGELSNGKMYKEGTCFDVVCGEINTVITNNNNNVVYMGSFRDFKKCGHGREYYSNGMVKFVGFFNNDEFLKGIHYSISGSLLYNGAFLNEQKCGAGEEYCTLSGKQMFSGIFLNDEKHGKGIVRFSSGNYAVGKFKNGNAYGVFRFFNKNKKLILTRFTNNKTKLNTEYFDGDYEILSKC